MTALDGSICPKCGAKVFTAKTTRGQLAPFDADPIAVYAMDPSGVMQNAGKGHTIHFATCTKPATTSSGKKPTPIDKVFPEDH